MKLKGSESNCFIARVESNISDKSLLTNKEFIFSIFSFNILSFELKAYLILH